MKLKNKNGFTIIELMTVIFIMSIIIISLSSIFKNANKISITNKNKNIIYRQVTDFYKTLSEDIASSFISLDASHFNKVNPIMTNDLKFFEGKKEYFSFIIKKKDHYSEAILNGTSNMPNNDTGWYKVTYKLLPDINDLSKSKLIRKIENPNIPINFNSLVLTNEERPIFFGKTNIENNDYIHFLADIDLLYDQNSIDFKEWFFAYYDGSNWKNEITSIPEKILVQPKYIYKDKTNKKQKGIRFRFIFDIN